MTTHAINTLILVKLDRYQNLDKKVIINGITVNYDVFCLFILILKWEWHDGSLA
jgi:hypothetical protein